VWKEEAACKQTSSKIEVKDSENIQMHKENSGLQISLLSISEQHLEFYCYLAISSFFPLPTEELSQKKIKQTNKQTSSCNNL
jgi:hypothetical protein